MLGQGQVQVQMLGPVLAEPVIVPVPKQVLERQDGVAASDAARVLEEYRHKLSRAWSRSA